MIRLSSKPIVEKMKSEIKSRAESVKKSLGRSPHLAVVLVGEDPASVIYTRNKGIMALELGMDHQTVNFPSTATPQEVKAKIDELNGDPRVDGILIQRPLPKQFNENDVLFWIHAEKDVDAFHPENLGRLNLGLPCFQPCTPSGVMEILNFYNLSPAGTVACVVGRSSIVGKPMAAMLLKADATVLQAHSRTRDLKAMTSQADILVVAAGKAGLIGREHIKPGAVVIDVGIHQPTSGGKLCGDVRFDEVAEVASAVTPVPGGVGPMTIMVLMQNTLTSAERKVKK